MKKIFLLLWFFCVYFAVFAQIKPSSYILKGKIDGKYEIEIYFSDNGDSNISGYYFYTNMLSPIALEGKWTAGKTLVLEYKDNANPKNSEKFAFEKPDLNKEMTGTWSKGSKTLKIAMQNVGKNYVEKNRKIFGDGINKIWEKSDIARDFLVDGLTKPFFVEQNGNFLLNENHSFQNYFHSESNFQFTAEYTGAGRMDLMKVEFRLLTANIPTILRSVYTSNYFSDPQTDEVEESSVANLSVWQQKGNTWINVSKDVFPAKNIGVDLANSTDFYFGEQNISAINIGVDKVIWTKKDKKSLIFEWINGKFGVK